MDFSAALAPAVSGSKLTMTRLVKRREQADLRLGEGGAGGGEDVVDAGHVDGDAVHLAFDEEGEVVGAHVGFGLVEIEEDVALGVERRSRAS